MRKTALTVLAVTLLLNGPRFSFGQPAAKDARKQEAPSEKSKVQQLMQRKRELSHAMLDAIITKDFKRIRQDAKELIGISQVAEWRVLQTPRYMQYSTEFQESAEKLADNARDKNSDGTTLAFTQMIFSCVRCHDYIRQTRTTRLEPDAPRGPSEQG
jgi:hypothetical protein